MDDFHVVRSEIPQTPRSHVRKHVVLAGFGGAGEEAILNALRIIRDQIFLPIWGDFT